MKGLAIKDVAGRTGLAAATIRMWEQRYGAPKPERTPAGYRVYSEEDVDLLKRAVALRERGFSVPSALDRARMVGQATDRPSIYGAIAADGMPTRPQLLRKRTLLAISRAIEDEMLARAAGPIVFGAFQRERNYRAVEPRYRRLAATAEAIVAFADFDAVRAAPGEPAEIPIAADDSLGNEWAVVVDAPGYAACLLAWERPRTAAEDAAGSDGDRGFESLLTMDPGVVRQAALVGCALTRRSCPELAERIERTLTERPLAAERPAAGLTALTNRLVAYLEA